MMFSGNGLEVPFDGKVEFKNRNNELVGSLKMQISTSLSSLFHVDKGLVKHLPAGMMQCKSFTTRSDWKKLSSFAHAWMAFMNDVIEVKFITQGNVYNAETVKNALHIWFVRKSEQTNTQTQASTTQPSPMNSPVSELPVGKI